MIDFNYFDNEESLYSKILPNGKVKYNFPNSNLSMNDYKKVIKIYSFLAGSERLPQNRARVISPIHETKGIGNEVVFLRMPNSKAVYHSSTTEDWLNNVINLNKDKKIYEAMKVITLVATKYKGTPEEESIISTNITKIISEEIILDDFILITLLRNTFVFRNRIAHWKKLLTKTEKQLTKHNKDAKRLLRGLN